MAVFQLESQERVLALFSVFSAGPGAQGARGAGGSHRDDPGSVRAAPGSSPRVPPARRQRHPQERPLQDDL